MSSWAIARCRVLAARALRTCSSWKNDTVSEDHIVGAAFGGVETVPACKRCNEAVGSGLEARLLSPTGWFTILSQGAGYTDGRVFGKTETGERVRMHFGGQGNIQLDPSHEVLSEEENGSKRIGVFLPPHVGDNYLAHVARTYGGSLTDVSRGHETPARWHQIELSGTVADCRRLVAKIALCSGAAKWGDRFLSSPLAGWLRIVLDVWSDWPEDVRPAPLDDPRSGGRWPSPEADVQHLINQVEGTVSPILQRAAQDLSTPVAPRLPPVTMFVPADRGRGTLVSVIVLGVALPAIGENCAIPSPIEPVTIVHPPRVIGSAA